MSPSIYGSVRSPVKVLAAAVAAVAVAAEIAGVIKLAYRKPEVHEQAAISEQFHPYLGWNCSDIAACYGTPSMGESFIGI